MWYIRDKQFSPWILGLKSLTVSPCLHWLASIYANFPFLFPITKQNILLSRVPMLWSETVIGPKHLPFVTKRWKSKWHKANSIRNVSGQDEVWQTYSTFSNSISKLCYNKPARNLRLLAFNVCSSSVRLIKLCFSKRCSAEKFPYMKAWQLINNNSNRIDRQMIFFTYVTLWFSLRNFWWEKMLIRHAPAPINENYHCRAEYSIPSTVNLWVAILSFCIEGLATIIPKYCLRSLSGYSQKLFLKSPKEF